MVKNRPVFSKKKLSQMVLMKSGVSITSENISDIGKYRCFGGNGFRGFTSTYTHEGNYVLIGRQGALCGNVSYVQGKIFASEHAVVVTPKAQTDIKFMSYVLYDMNLNQYSESSAQPGLSVKKLLELKYAFPDSKSEQIMIAEALSDVDSLITSLKKLIEKKKAIKQGTIQELLTGKKRLPGFSGAWKLVTLGSVCDILNGDRGNNYPTNGEMKNSGIPFVNAGHLKNNLVDFSNMDFISEEKYLTMGGAKIRENDILICLRGSLGKYATANFDKGALASSLALLRCKEDSILTKFLFQILGSSEFSKMISEENNGSSQPNLSATSIKCFQFFLPNVKEQQAIAQVLSDMDTEIKTLEKKLDKYHQIKQGMMQELLTGRIRLLDTETLTKPVTQKTQVTIELPAHKPHNQQFDDAVMIASIVNSFYSDKFPLGRKKVQKLLYLMRRKEQADTSAFHKKAAGPYADEVRYKGGEPIAKKNQYIQISKNDKGSRFVRGKKIEQALAYLEDWGKQPDMDWLVSQFQFTSVNELELLATVDMAICDLHQEGKRVSVHDIKELISSTKEWREKLNKTYFKDSDIQRAIQKCEELFGTE